MLPTVEAVCTTEACPARGRVRQVVVRMVAAGVLGVPRLACASCGAWMEENMPKITRHGGPSIKGEAPQDATPQEPVEPAVPAESQDAPEVKPTPKRRARKADAETSIQVTAEAQVTGPDGTVR